MLTDVNVVHHVSLMFIDSFNEFVEKCSIFSKMCLRMLLYKKTFVTVSVDVAIQTLRVGWEQLLTSVARSINEVENQARKLRSLS